MVVLSRDISTSVSADGSQRFRVFSRAAKFPEMSESVLKPAEAPGAVLENTSDKTEKLVGLTYHLAPLL